MRALVVYESIWGNTERIARAISNALEPAVAVDVFDSDAAPPSIDGYDLVFVGGPTHAFSMSLPATRAAAETDHGASEVPARGIREWIQDLRSGSSARVFTFDTRVDSPRLPGSAAKAARRELKSLGFRVDAKPATFHVHGYAGPLVDGEVERAAEWTRGLAPVAVG